MLTVFYGQTVHTKRVVQYSVLIIVVVAVHYVMRELTNPCDDDSVIFRDYLGNTSAADVYAPYVARTSANRGIECAIKVPAPPIANI